MVLARRGIPGFFEMTNKCRMSDLQKYIEQRNQRDPDFAEGLESGYADFKIGVLLRQTREAAGLTQEQVARQLGTQKSAISRIENHLVVPDDFDDPLPV